jgi:acyl-CoA reductase-like NAD-dependent aldehyde dehydrogenase
MDLPGYFYEPTIISEATMEMQVAHDKILGPLATIFPICTEAEAVLLANES